MKKQLFLGWLLLVSTPVLFTSNTVCAAAVQEDDSFDDFDFDELELAFDQADLAGQELVKPPSKWVVFFRRIASPIGVAVIKLCDAIRNRWQRMVRTQV